MKLPGKLASRFAVAALAFGMATAEPAFAQGDFQSAPASDPTETTAPETSQPEQSSYTSTDWQLNPLVPVGVAGGLFAFSLLLSGLAASRGVKGAWMRAAAGGALTLMLLNPEKVEEERTILPTDVAIVVDKSASQTLDNRQEITEEMQRRLLGELAKKDNLNIRIIEVDSVKNSATNGTKAFEAIQSGLSDISRDRLGAVIILTDGQIHDIPDGNPFPGTDIPLHVLVSGHGQEVDRRVVLEEAPRFGIVGEKQTISFRVLDDGARGNEDIKVTITRDGEELATQTVKPGAYSSVTLDIPHTGANLVEIKAEPLAGELTELNNRIVASVEGIEQSLSVLLVSGSPNQGTRMWRDLLKADPAIDLVHFPILQPEGKQDYTPLREKALIPFPIKEMFADKLDQFDLVILDQYEYRGMIGPHYLANLRDYVREGGALLVVSGSEYNLPASIAKTPLASILPASPAGSMSETPYKPLVTDAGQRHPVTRNLGGGANTDPAWGQWLSVVNVGTPKGDVVLKGNSNKPLLILNREEDGRVAMLLSGDAWLWARGYQGGGPHAELLQRVSHWLLKNPELEEEALRITREGDKLIIEQQTMEDVGSPVTVTTPSGKTITVTPEETSPGLLRASIPAGEFGLYSAAQNGRYPATAFANVGVANPQEFSNTLSSTTLLKAVTEATGGSIARMVNGAGNLSVPKIILQTGDEKKKIAGRNEIDIHLTESSDLQGAKTTPVIPAWLSLLVAVGFLAGSWYLEGERNLFKKEGKITGPKNNGPSPQ